MTTGPKGQKRPADVTPEPPDGEARRRSPEAASKCRTHDLKRLSDFFA
jgi:hypothetical protein